jgi:hypothetical protein
MIQLEIVACCLLFLLKNSFFHFCEQPYEDSNQSSIWMSIRDEQTGQWSTPIIAVRIPGTCTMNPSLFRNDEGTLFLTFHAGGSRTNDGTCDTDNWSGAFVTSTK